MTIVENSELYYDELLQSSMYGSYFKFINRFGEIYIDAFYSTLIRGHKFDKIL